MLVSSMDHLNYYAMQKESSNAAGASYHPLDPLDAASPSNGSMNLESGSTSNTNGTASSSATSDAAAAVAVSVGSNSRNVSMPSSSSHLQQSQYPLTSTTSLPLRIPTNQQQQPPPLVTINPNVLGLNMSLAGMNGDDGVMPASSPTYTNNEENSPKNGTKSSLYKTELCKRFSEFGSCRYGAKCQFAHGVGELRHVVRHPKYKTTKCKSYWGSGHCPYGSRCRFIHEETEGIQASSYGNVNGLYLRDKDPLTGMPGAPTASNGLMSPPNSTGGFMMPGAEERGVGSYAKEYYMSSSYDKPSLVLGNDARNGMSSSSGSKMSFMNGNDRQFNGNGMRTLNGNAADGVHGPGYPDLQDAIDALMKFSLSSQENETLLGTISTTPAELPAVNQPTAKRTADFSLGADELWKDFSVGTSVLNGGGMNASESLQTSQWPMTSSGLSLSLENSVFDPTLPGPVATSALTGTTSPPPASTPVVITTTSEDGSSPVKKANSESPRLSVFERFH